MAIHRTLRNTPWGPEESGPLIEAYEQTLKALGLKDRNDPITDIVAEKIVEIRGRGVRDAVELWRIALKELGAHPPSP
jgi:hypothetical protein